MSDKINEIRHLCYDETFISSLQMIDEQIKQFQNLKYDYKQFGLGFLVQSDFRGGKSTFLKHLLYKYGIDDCICLNFQNFIKR